MIWLAALLLACSIVVTAALVAAALRAEHDDDQPGPDSLLAERLRDRFVVTVLSGESFTGLLMEADDRTVVLRDVSVMKPDGAKLPVDGEVILRRDSIAYMQKP